MVGIQDRVVALRSAAMGGDNDAACELGRLLCLRPYVERASWDENQWAAEPWLRQGLAARPDDHITATLLACCLTQMVDMMEATYLSVDDDPVETAMERRAAEALDLFQRVLDTRPADPAATAGLTVLRQVVEEDRQCPPVNPYSYYLLTQPLENGSMVGALQLVATDLAELRWAADLWVLTQGGFSDCTLIARTHDQTSQTIDLGAAMPDGRADWDALTIAPLPGPLLPVAHPVGTRGSPLDEQSRYPWATTVAAYYGFSSFGE